jgi:hypothetical protein
MPVYSQFLTPVSAVSMPGGAGGTPVAVGTTVDFGVVYSGFTAWVSVDPSSGSNAEVAVDTSIDNATWSEGPGNLVSVGQAQVIAVQPGRYVRVRGYATAPSGSSSSVLTVQVAVES